jgi:hypothetical protein
MTWGNSGGSTDRKWPNYEGIRSTHKLVLHFQSDVTGPSDWTDDYCLAVMGTTPQLCQTGSFENNLAAFSYPVRERMLLTRQVCTQGRRTGWTTSDNDSFRVREYWYNGSAWTSTQFVFGPLTFDDNDVVGRPKETFFPKLMTKPLDACNNTSGNECGVNLAIKINSPVDPGANNDHKYSCFIELIPPPPGNFETYTSP